MTQQKEEEMALNQASTKNIPVTKTSLHSLAHSLSTLFFSRSNESATAVLHGKTGANAPCSVVVRENRLL